MTPRPPPMPPRGEPAGSPRSGPTWAGDVAEAASTIEPRLATRQMPLFDAADLAPAATPARRVRLPGRIKALLTAIETPGRRPPASGSGPTGLAASVWPDSFFDLPPVP